ncbi:lytic murein transglycosylase [Nisaea acidiphila]|uniref:Lytic murein transglycosylase n=1 Tax=Nisaea acidiphila TaxID=1862145 RepID=A0A9J7AV29_9PROT|nr:lytic murein transglycosylase [Nisaea acidiphila]UUX50164.1 lytic murein transglycosylase [Nisaea acidiphila]
MIGRYLLAAGLLVTAAFGPAEAIAAQPFEDWVKELKAEAAGQGIDQKILDQAFAGVAPIPRVIELDRKQPEFTLTFEQYLTRVVPNARIQKGRKLLAENKALLTEVSEKYGVQPRFIVALWGVETDFGRITGGFPVVASLATLAHDGRRSAFFRKELLLALKILDEGHIAPGDMKGSWAGAMGQSQFMPSSFHNFAVDHNGDGHKDIWGTKEDVFASIANYLSRSGWNADTNWGRAVALPAGFDKSLVDSKKQKTMREWEALGVKRRDGGPLPERNLSSHLVVPGDGELAPAYLAYANYDVILKWNRSSYFATAVGTLADAIGRP